MLKLDCLPESSCLSSVKVTSTDIHPCSSASVYILACSLAQAITLSRSLSNLGSKDAIDPSFTTIFEVVLFLLTLMDFVMYNCSAFFDFEMVSLIAYSS